MASVYSSEYSYSETLPERPLVVKCSHDGKNKRITFNSCRGTTYDFFRKRIEDSFSLSATMYAIQYTDDDGEVTDITSDGDLSEAIRYFHTGSDEAPSSSAASILSGRSFGRQRVTMRVKIAIDYDGPSLSDTGSLASLEEYRERNGSELSFSFSSARTGEVDDDSITVSSKDMGSKYDKYRGQGPRTIMSGPSRDPLIARPPRPPSSDWDEQTVSSVPRSFNNGTSSRSPQTIREDAYAEGTDPSFVFERLKRQESREGSSPGSTLASSHLQTERGAAWLRDQNARAVKSVLGNLPEPSESDAQSVGAPDDARSSMGGELELQKDGRGKFYYAYTGGPSSASHSSCDSGYDEASSITFDTGSNIDITEPSRQSLEHPPVPNRISMSSSSSPSRASSSSSSSSIHQHHPAHRSHSEPILARTDIPTELLPFIDGHTLPPTELTDCSNCGALLDSLRYVCSTCGEKEPHSHSSPTQPTYGKGKGKDLSLETRNDTFTYPPRSRAIPTASSHTLVGGEDPFHDGYSVGYDTFGKPLPALPSSPPNGPSSPHLHSGSSRSSGSSGNPGYELCANCIESVGVIHALEDFAAPGSSPRPNDWPPSPEEQQRAFSQLRRTAPRNKGQLRHAFLEKQWGPRGWQDVEQDNTHSPKCSACADPIVHRRYKCFSCADFSLCRGCYSLVHEIHPSHAFLAVPERPIRMRSEPALENPIIVTDTTGEPSMTHVGVKCAHCLREIVGARFHCAICPSVDICSNCDSAGLPGNLDSADGGHNSSHIMIKIPHPLSNAELQTASRLAIERWDKDGPRMDGSRPRRDSLISSYARTVIGRSTTSLNNASTSGETDSHGVQCAQCRKNIVGVRYQCGSCPSKPTAYNLCAECEPHSYVSHDPMHVFFKLPRPVDTPIESEDPILPPIYKVPAGPVDGVYNSYYPSQYLQTLTHRFAVCDRCMLRIVGEWFRCVYCPKDLCFHCESNDTHDNSHFFMVFKSQVDMEMFRDFAQIRSPSPSPALRFQVYRQ
ncbi:hypothetical protein BXZ70DRAFT_963595 [Cristinia sonorae]|uniref:Uncharacterized protein n=1 Tax=Cristinia sonorae TaxID=1940300 RepID=A0A8K0UCS5_9AGAR|nr:hypothetical protein BXZ70DRAFT_963595 [Cristinia sonorae]